MDSGEFTWNVDKQTLQRMKKCGDRAEFQSPTFQIAGLSWKMETYPNGNREDNAGSFLAFVKSISMPDHWKHIECCIQIRCNETMSAVTIYQQYQREIEWMAG